MNINWVRIANILLSSIMIFSGQWNYLWYIGAMHLSLEILNRQSLYLEHPYKFNNFIFWTYELVLLERLRTWHFSGQVEWLMNGAEHLAFGIIICLKIYIYTALFSNEHSLPRWKRGLIAFIVFNIIGILNEIFQNSLSDRIYLFILIPDSIKDIKMNLMGACIFMLAVLCRFWWLKKNTATALIQ